MADLYLQVYKEFISKLTGLLPMKDVIFISNLAQKSLFYGDLKAQVKSKSDSAEAAEHFLSNAIELPMINGDCEPFTKLLTVMEEFDSTSLKKLAAEIRQQLPTASSSFSGQQIISLL